MRNRVSKSLTLAVAVLLLGAGGAFAGDNAGATFTLSSPTEFTGIGPGDATVTVAVDASGLVGVKQYDITLAVTPADAFDLSATAFAAPSGFIVPGTEVDQAAGTVKVGAANFFAALDGDAALGTFTLTTSSTFTTSTAATITVQSISVGPSSTDRDAFDAATLGLEVAINPPAPAPTISGIAPAEGTISGGTAVQITGTNFADGASVTIGGVAVSDVTFVDASTLSITTPAGSAAGAVDVVVSNPDGQAATLTGGFTYQAVIEPTLTAVGATDRMMDYSAIGSGSAEDGSAGEVTLSVQFTDASGAASAGQSVAFEIVHNGGETVYVLGGAGVEVGPGSVETVTVNTDAAGVASVTLDAEGSKTSSSTSLTITATTSAANSEGAVRDLSVGFAVTWDVPVVAELAAFTGSVTPAGSVVLQWSVVSQTSNLGWQVERSVDGVNFEPVGDLVRGAGTSDAFLTYSFTDSDVPVADVVYYSLRQTDLDGSTARSQVIEVSMADVQAVPTHMALLPSYPNPFNPETTISFDVDAPAQLTLRIFDAAGQVVRTLIAGETYQAGRYAIVWNGLNESGEAVGSGVYFCQLSATGFTSMQKMTLLR